MQHAARDAAAADLGIAAHHLACGLRRGNRMARGQVGAHQQRVDPGRVPAQHHVLVGVRKNLRLHEIAGREQPGQRRGLAHVAQRVGEKVLGAMVETVAHAGGVDMDAIGGANVKMLRQFL